MQFIRRNRSFNLESLNGLPIEKQIKKLKRKVQKASKKLGSARNGKEAFFWHTEQVLLEERLYKLGGNIDPLSTLGVAEPIQQPPTLEQQEKGPAIAHRLHKMADRVHKYVIEKRHQFSSWELKHFRRRLDKEGVPSFKMQPYLQSTYKKASDLYHSLSVLPQQDEAYALVTSALFDIKKNHHRSETDTYFTISDIERGLEKLEEEIERARETTKIENTPPNLKEEKLPSQVSGDNVGASDKVTLPVGSKLPEGRDRKSQFAKDGVFPKSYGINVSNTDSEHARTILGHHRSLKSLSYILAGTAAIVLTTGVVSYLNHNDASATSVVSKNHNNDSSIVSQLNHELDKTGTLEEVTLSSTAAEVPLDVETSKPERTLDERTLQVGKPTYDTEGKHTEEKHDPVSLPKTESPIFGFDHVEGNEYVIYVRGIDKGELLFGGLEERVAVPVKAGNTRFFMGTKGEGDMYIALMHEGKMVASVAGPVEKYLPHLSISDEELEKSGPGVTVGVAIDCQASYEELRERAVKKLHLTPALNGLEEEIAAETDPERREDMRYFQEFLETTLKNYVIDNYLTPCAEPLDGNLLSAVRDYHVNRRGSAANFKTVDEIVAKHDVSAKKLRAAVDAYGIERRSARTTVKDREDRQHYVADGLRRGMTLKELASDSGWSYSTICRDAKRIEKLV